MWVPHDEIELIGVSVHILELLRLEPCHLKQLLQEAAEEGGGVCTPRDDGVAEQQVGQSALEDEEERVVEGDDVVDHPHGQILDECLDLCVALDAGGQQVVLLTRVILAEGRALVDLPLRLGDRLAHLLRDQL